MSKQYPLVLVAAAFVGCAAKPIDPNAHTVILSTSAPARDCVYVGESRGSQGNFWTAEFTSDENLIVGARNELRNSAVRLGANFVKIETESISQNTAYDSLGGAYAVVLIGNAYRCPAPKLTLVDASSG